MEKSYKRCQFIGDHLVPESSIARSAVHAQSEKSKWAESVVYCHLVSTMTTMIMMDNDKTTSTAGSELNGM